MNAKPKLTVPSLSKRIFDFFFVLVYKLAITFCVINEIQPKKKKKSKILPNAQLSTVNGAMYKSNLDYLTQQVSK